MSGRLHLVNVVSSLLPQTRAFRFRRSLYSWAGVRVGEDVRLNGGVVIQNPNVTLGKGVWVGRRSEFVASARAPVTIGTNCDISQDVLFVTGTHEVGTSERRAGTGRSDAITVGDGTWIGARATILGGSSVGRGCIVGAGSLVKGVFPDNVVLVGSPARVVREL